MEGGERGLAVIARSIGRTIADALFPEHCAGCDLLGVAFCDRCLAATVPFPVMRRLSDGTAVRALYPYGDPRLRALLRAYKFRGRTTLREPIRFLVSKALSAGVFGETLYGATLVPIPLSRRRERERGFNQAAEIAGILAEAAGGGAAVDPVLKRVRDTAQQSKLAKEKRRENIAGAFVASHALGPERPVVLVDDVVTTGETFAAAVAALEAAGIRVTGCFALAHADPDSD